MYISLSQQTVPRETIVVFTDVVNRGNKGYSVFNDVESQQSFKTGCLTLAMVYSCVWVTAWSSLDGTAETLVAPGGDRALAKLPIAKK
jgi:hypothetical protein